MSAICGIWHRDNSPVAPQDLTRMMEALAPHGPDGGDIRLDHAVAFGHQMMHITPESLQEKLPLHDPNTQFTITADARLDNRLELCDQFQIPRAERAHIPDGALILRAYEQWQEACVEHLIGAFAFALWDARRRRLICAIDPMGEFRLFYWFDQRRFIFASEVKGIHAVPGVARCLDERHLAALAFPFVDVGDHDGTLFEKIRRVPAARRITITAEQIKEYEYWKPNPTLRLPYLTDTQILEGLREQIFATVRARTRCAFPVGAFLSGGLDSSAVVAVASRVLQESGQRLTTFSAVLPENAPPHYRDEREFMDEFRTCTNLERVLIRAEGRGPFDDVEEVIRRAETPLITSRHFLYAAFAEAARARNIRVLLDGVGGEYGPSSSAPGLLAEWLRRWQWRPLWRELRAMSRVQHKAAWRIFGKQAVFPLLPAVLQRARASNDTRSWIAWSQSSPLRTDFARSLLKDELRRSRSNWDRVARTRPDHRRNQANGISLVRGGMVVGGFKGDESVWLPIPLFDQRVVEYCLAAPGHLKLHNGFGRNLLRASLDGLLPRAIQWRTSKAPFSPDYPERYNRQRPGIHAWLSSIPRHDPIHTIVDVEKLQHLASEDCDSNQNSSSNFAALNIVPFCVYLIHFLRGFDAFR